MMAQLWASRFVAGALAGMLCVAWALCAEPPGNAADKDKAQTAESAAAEPKDAEPKDAELRVPVAVARDRAKLMHQIYASTLKVMHHRYFHEDKAAIPARAMEDVFSEISWRAKIDARWIAANTQAMSLDHEPADEFEKQAAKEISAGKDEYESIEKGVYRRAGAIPLGAGCVNCHTGFSGLPPKSSRYAGLVISMPVNEE